MFIHFSYKSSLSTDFNSRMTLWIFLKLIDVSLHHVVITSCSVSS